jgi:hypothetical protein
MPFQSATALACFRFINAYTAITEGQVNALLRALAPAPCAVREAFFLEVSPGRVHKRVEEDDPAGWVVDSEETPRWAAGGIDPPRPESMRHTSIEQINQEAFFLEVSPGRVQKRIRDTPKLNKEFVEKAKQDKSVRVGRRPPRRERKRLIIGGTGIPYGRFEVFWKPHLHSFIHSLIHSIIHSFNSFNHSFNHSFIQFIHSFILRSYRRNPSSRRAHKRVEEDDPRVGGRWQKDAMLGSRGS